MDFREIYYRPIREHYRKLVFASIPSFVTYRQKVGSPSTVELDTTFLDHIQSITPKEYVPDFLARCALINRLGLDVYPSLTFYEQFIYRGITDAFLKQLAVAHCQYDALRTARGLSTSTEMFRHVLGVEPTLLSFDALPFS